ncbi:radial spoke head 14 homolog [Tribolium castaneum]|uniref:radial spoke head 14 homolog n=1 Tax=Tribolium castaneum TaxID=7070 RepID=UPI00046C2512|nr:PREDICTED: radial spoke head 14 homolog [Tribolium castaneum]|eukprot:XP_008191792.1 PREDICTED: radial spoke head 14 homolog [Tribolium castaneum]
MFSINRNSYLHTRSSSVNPRIINRCVDLARSQPTLHDSSYFEPPFYRLTSEQPDIPCEFVDPTRRQVAFGKWALPKLRRELHDEDELVVIQALRSISDLVHDPEKAFEAIRLRIPDRLCDKLLDPLPPVRENAALILAILAELADGKDAILRNDSILENLYLCLGDGQMSVRLKIASCFKNIATLWTTADVLVDYGLIQTLLEIIDKEEDLDIVLIHLETLQYLMYECGKCVALKNQGFRIFSKYLDHESPAIVCKALDCLSILTSTKKGKKLALEKKLLKTLNRLLHYGDVDICTSAASVVMFCTVKTRAKHAAAEIKPLPKRLVKLATNPLNSTLQMFCLKVKSVGPKLVPFFKTVTIYFVVFLPYNLPSVLSTILKCLPILSLMLFVLLHGMSLGDEYKYSRRILVGLIFCCLGDAFLIWPGYFEAGMLAFAIGHINYILAFGFKPLNLTLGACLYAISVMGIAYLMSGLHGILVPGVIIYTFILTTMMWRAIARVQFFEDLWTWSKLCSCVGGILFVLSDLILGLDRFKFSVDYSQALVMSTYYAAQLGIALSVVDAKSQRKVE